MNLMHEDLALAHCAHRLAEAERAGRQRRLVAAARAQRRAEKSSERARRLLAVAVMN
jgi:hypothetical protein